MEEYLLSCDWGTTSFRLRLVRKFDHRTVGEVLSQRGASETYNLWKETSAGGSKEDFFRAYLKEQIDQLQKKVEVDISEYPVVLSGMASSSIGMREIPYASLPFLLDGADIGLHYFEKQSDFPNEILLLSGVRSEHDVMRGEETQLIGLNALADLDEEQEAVYIFPGTHSKHLYIKKSQLVDFKTFMTGEVFNLMVNNSILKDSVASSGAGNADWAAFNVGVAASGVSSILNTLFTVRTNQLFDLLDKEQNGMYLSGLLIGSEMRSIPSEKRVILCGGNNLSGLYEKAMGALKFTNSIVIPADLVDSAAAAGHIKVFEQLKSTLNKVDL